ncbi:hypothetical protein Pyn_21410 [Prunus yedoensis var. nudiflora]|uniref:Uncharacterized protein n=1 Tax=Prunus yedoensis var. nudiflora TaxID=2094558 RepID=A0A314ZDH6_PRUYE|nr:hypothetical protein Pyn_21410 [Prunus yedoensis var. nudiflora]
MARVFYLLHRRWFLPTWRSIDEAAATEMSASPAAIAAVFSAPLAEDPALPELIPLSAT